MHQQKRGGVSVCMIPGETGLNGKQSSHRIPRVAHQSPSHLWVDLAEGEIAMIRPRLRAGYIERERIFHQAFGMQKILAAVFVVYAACPQKKNTVGGR